MKGTDTPTGGMLELAGLRKVHGTTVAVDRIDLRIAAGEFFSLLGPSGCGKTTTLQMIGGFEAPTGGRVLLDGADLTGMPAHRRPINTVFQSYALFPHLTVAQNVEYGLRWRAGVGKAERRTRAGEALDLVRLSALAGRRPTQLSGGEQQRVALARALVCRPSVLLLDEPFGALDAKLRKALRAELTAVQRAVGTTFVFVTHDQEEALEISDRIAVMDHGRVVQCGRPKDVYETPDTEFVADFLGLTNLLEVTCVGGPDVRLGEFTVTCTPVGGDVRSGPGRIVIRPERVRLEAAGGTGANRVPAIVDRLVYVGATSQVLVRLPHGPVVQVMLVNDSDHDHLRAGEAVTLHLPPAAVRLLAPEPAPSAVRRDEEMALTGEGLTTD
ncbi:ABC transporter ATP-binding protein [Virgisporangium ochraceum]|uniref:ABC transporter ATP-binding protein n=1 Tax=Virgisporangium ochraceum TaxID=65505 RepID=A0A8J4EFI9_9ACTN|nr:ABC transporter ATP-binding protein [Virgisporangium ochraceum]GIJ73750.1 ABC transporter ATP-binding protein [Virgisporangium ochraceum]